MRKATKTIISFAVVLIVGLNFIVLAFAQDPFTAIAIGGLTGASGAGLFGSMAGMSGVDIAWGNNTPDRIDAMWNVLNPDHVYFSGEKHEANPQQYPEDVYDYIDVDIGDWLSAQSDFIVNFIQANNVQNNSQGVVQTTYEWNGVPLNNSGYGQRWSEPISQHNLSTTVGATDYYAFPGGYYLCNITSYNPDNGRIDFRSDLYFNGQLITSNNAYHWTFRDPLQVEILSSIQGGQVSVRLANIGGTVGVQTNLPNQTTNSPSTVPWSSTTVNTNVFNGWEAARIKIPHSVSGLTSGWTIPDFTNALNDLWEQGQQGQIVIEDTDQPVPPVPPTPIPDTPLGEVPFDDWIDLWGQGIWSELENQSDALDFIGSNGTDMIEELESIDENIGALEETAESIDTNIGIGNGILGGIRSLAQSAVDYLEGIAEHVGELVEEIVASTETLIAGILNQIPQAFGVIFGPIKQASSIWHYVVEWIQSIGAPFQFIWSMASGTSYYVILPVYASLAAAVVLAFFKRFGR